MTHIEIKIIIGNVHLVPFFKQNINSMGVTFIIQLIWYEQKICSLQSLYFDIKVSLL